MTKPTLFVTAVALINGEGKILLAQRPMGKDMAGLWEFPGGKVHEDETPEEALVREAQEELGIRIQPSHLYPLTFASHDYPDFHLFMPLYTCRVWQGKAEALENQAIEWVDVNELTTYDMPPADAPLIPALKKALA